MRYFLSFFCCACLSTSVAAAAAPESRHTLGVSVAAADASFNNDYADGDLVSHLGAYYEYRINNRISFHMSAVEGESECIVCFYGNDDNATDYRSFQLSIKAATDFSRRWNLFARGGANFYRIKYQTGESGIDATTPYNPWLIGGSSGTPIYKTTSGRGALMAAGGQFRANNGFNLNLEYFYLPVNQGNLKGVNLYLGYSL